MQLFKRAIALLVCLLFSFQSYASTAGGGNYPIVLTGDVSGSDSGTGSVTSTLATVNSAPGTYGGASTSPVMTINGKGLVTVSTSTPIIVGLTTGVSGVLKTVNGGTGVSSPLTINTTSTLTANPVSGATAEYPLLDGSGTSATDISGNGNTGTLSTVGGSLPTWTSYGLSMNGTIGSAPVSSYVQTPVKTWRTAVIHACNATLQQTSGIASAVPFSTYPTLSQSNSSSDGIILLSGYSSATQHVGGFIPGIFFNGAGSTFNTTVATPIGPCFTIAYALDSVDHIYINGVEAPNYKAQNSDASKVTTTSAGYTIGGYVATNAWAGTINYAVFYPGVLTPAQIQAVSSYVTYQVTNRPGFPVPTQAGTTQPSLIGDGDSLTSGYNGTAAWFNSTNISTTNSYNITQWSIGGQLAKTAQVMNPLRSYTAISSVSGNCIFYEANGTNDLGNGISAQETWGALQKIGQDARARGARTIIATVLDRSGGDTNKNNVNALIRQYGKTAYDFVLDNAAIPVLGANGAYTNTACFNADLLHLTGPGAGTCYKSLTGYGVLALEVGRAVNMMDGSTAALPNTTTSNAYTETDADNFLVQTPSASATNTLIDCTGFTGIVRTIVNGSSSNAITVSTSASQTITGSATVAANATASFTCELTSASAGGNYWLRTQ